MLAPRLITRHNNFDFLRFCFAFSVVIYHLIVLTGNATLVPLRRFFDGNMPVGGFFIISGFLISHSWAQGKGIQAYANSRMRRLLPAYIGVIVLSASFFVLLSSYSATDYFSHPGFWRYLVANLLFLNFVQPELPGVFSSHIVQAINGSLWTIKIEVSFYIVLPMLFAILRRQKNLLRTNILLAALYLSAPLYVFFCQQLYAATQLKLFSVLGHQLPGCMDYFATGLFLYFNSDSLRKYQHIAVFPSILLVASYYVFRMDLLFALGLGICIHYVAFHFRALNNFAKHGDVSYGIYIYHFPIIQASIALGMLAPALGIGYCYTLALVMLAGLLSWHLVEKRFLPRAATH